MSTAEIPAVLPARLRPMLEGRLPRNIAPLWWATPDELERLAPEAQIGWFDLFEKPPALRALASAERLEWLNTAFAGIDWLPLGDLAARGVTLTNGAGITAGTVAEFTVLGMLAIFRDYRAIVRAADRGEWLHGARDARELEGTSALLLGYGEIGRRIGGLLDAFGVDTVAVRRTAGEGTIGPDEWRDRLGAFDWVILALPSTAETRAIIGAGELEAMRPSAVLVNVGRAECVDQPALIEALRKRRIGGAMLDLTDPEPLPPGHPLWTLENAHLTMHQAGMPNQASTRRAAERFITNCERFVMREKLIAHVDLARGY